MVDYIVGINGIGKTRVLAEAAIATSQMSDGNVVFIDCTNGLERILPLNIRLININDYGIKSAMSFYGFLSGICASDYDLTDVFIDSITDIISDKETDINDLFEFLSGISNSLGVNFHFSVYDKYVPELIYQD